jgi:hypothetical protein
MGLSTLPIKVPEIYPVSIFNGSERTSGTITSAFFSQPEMVIPANKKIIRKKANTL